MTEPLTIGPLEPGLYVIEIDRDLPRHAVAEMRERLMILAPECRFIILAGGAHLARNPSVQEGHEQVA